MGQILKNVSNLTELIKQQIKDKSSLAKGSEYKIKYTVIENPSTFKEVLRKNVNIVENDLVAKER